MKRIVLYIIPLLVITASCSDYLDEVQDNRTLIDTEDKVAALLVYAYPDAQFAPFTEIMSDNADDKNTEGVTGF